MKGGCRPTTIRNEDSSAARSLPCCNGHLFGAEMKFRTLAFIAVASASPVYAANPMGVQPLGYVSSYTLNSQLASYRVLFNGATGHVPNFRDYFGLFPAGSSTRLQWFYLDGTKTRNPERLQLTGACTFEGLKPGNYAVRVYAAGGTDKMLDSVMFTVPEQYEYRAIPGDGAITIERTVLTPSVDKLTLKRSGNGNIDIYTVPSGVSVKVVGVTYTSQGVTAAPAKTAPAAVNKDRLVP
jgi:hypothetical protein